LPNETNVIKFAINNNQYILFIDKIIKSNTNQIINIKNPSFGSFILIIIYSHYIYL